MSIPALRPVASVRKRREPDVVVLAENIVHPGPFRVPFAKPSTAVKNVAKAKPEKLGGLKSKSKNPRSKKRLVHKHSSKLTQTDLPSTAECKGELDIAEPECVKVTLRKTVISNRELAVAEVPYPANMSPSRVRDNPAARTVQIVFTRVPEEAPAEPATSGQQGSSENDAGEARDPLSAGCSQAPVISSVWGSSTHSPTDQVTSVKIEPKTESFSPKAEELLTAAAVTQPLTQAAVSSLDPSAFVVKKVLLTPKKESQSASVPDHAVATSSSSATKRCWLPQAKTTPEKKPKLSCPSYKKVKNTTFAVDAFSHGRISGVSAYFLTHFHWDHYNGLSSKFDQPIHCNKVC